MKTTSMFRQPTQPVKDAEDRAYAFLQERRSGVLATLDDESHSPYASVVYYSVAPDRSIRFLTKQATKKAQNIGQEGLVMLVVYDEGQQAVVQIRGTARPVQDSAETHQQFMRTLRSSLGTAESAVPPVSKLEAGDHVAYAIMPDEITFSEYRRRRSYRIQSP